jgi:hypothetical protein
MCLEFIFALFYFFVILIINLTLSNLIFNLMAKSYQLKKLLQILLCYKEDEITSLTFFYLLRNRKLSLFLFPFFEEDNLYLSFFFSWFTFSKIPKFLKLKQLQFSPRERK